jgi:hypothetical protein
MGWKTFSFMDKLVFVSVVLIAGLIGIFFTVNDSVESSKEPPEVPMLAGFEEYQEQLDLLNDRRRGESFCALQVDKAVRQNSKGSWQQVVQVEPCFTISEDLDNRKFTQAELESASNWYMEFLLREVFDGPLLDEPESLQTWLVIEAPKYFTNEVLALVAENPDGEFEVDGMIMSADEMVANWSESNSNFYAYTADGGPRILAIEGGLGADFYFAEENQIDMTGGFSVYYRVDKSIYIESLIEKENWTIEALKEQQPELFDSSPLAVRVDASVGHTLEKTENGGWIVTRWSAHNNYTFRVAN